MVYDLEGFMVAYPEKVLQLVVLEDIIWIIGNEQSEADKVPMFYKLKT